MPRLFYDQDADLGLLDHKTVAILGYGSQGHAHALNLRDSGVSVVVGLHPQSASRERARSAGLEVLPVSDAAKRAQVVMVLVPDTVQAALYREHVARHLQAGDTLMFAHGFNIRYGQIEAPDGVDVSMVAPKAPGHRVREVFQDGAGTPALLAVEQNSSGRALEQALAYAKGLGCTRAGVIETTFAEETETDLFGEQAVLCGGASALVRAGFETLVDAGYQPEVAYFECLHELKLIVDLMYEQGIGGMRYSISDTAEYGDLTRGPRIVNDSVKAEMQQILSEIQDGSFAEEWIAESRAGRPNFHALEEAGAAHSIESVGAELRAMMPWISEGKTSVQDASGGQG